MLYLWSIRKYMNDDSFEVRNKEAEDYLRDVGRILKENTPKGMGFTLLLFDYGDGGNMFYTSSAKREDMIKALKEFIQKQQH